MPVPSDTTSPSVMLSPKAEKYVTLMWPGAVTVTVNAQDDVVAFASVAVHVTVVVPAGKRLSLAGAQDTGAGGTPPEANALAYRIEIGAPVCEAVVTGAGHVTLNAGAGGVAPDGAFELPVHAP